MSNFYNDMLAATSEEHRFARYLRTRGWQTYEAEKGQNLRGIDLAATKGELFRTFDVKSDGVIAKTGNIALEYYTEYDSDKPNRPGWATKAVVDHWVILYRNENRAIILYPDEIIPKLDELAENYPVRPTHRDAGKRTYNILIPTGNFIQEGLKMDRLEWK